MYELRPVYGATGLARRTTGVGFPWADLDPIFDEVDRHLAAAFGLGPLGGPRSFAVGRAPAVDVRETDTAYEIVAELPGVPKERIEVRVHGPHVALRASAATEPEGTGTRLHEERRSVELYRAFELPGPVVAAQAKASLENGLLRLTLPKEAPAPVPGEVKVPIA